MRDPFLDQLMFFQNPENRADYVSVPGGTDIPPQQLPPVKSFQVEQGFKRSQSRPKINPLAQAPVTAQEPPMPTDDDRYNQMMDEILKERKGSIEGIQKQIENAQNGGHWSDQLNLQPLVAWYDSMNKTNLSPGFGGPTPEEKRQAVIAKLGDALQKQKDAYADDALSFFKNKAYMDQVKAQTQNAGADREFDQWYKKQKLQLDREALNQKNSGLGEPTKGQEALDKAFAKTYEEEFLSGKIASAEKNLDSLKDVSANLATRDDLTGGFVGSTPMMIRRRFFQESADNQQKVEDVVQQSLKAILGAQFTEKEAARLIERAYDPAASESINKERVDRLYKALRKGIESKKAAGRHFEKNGTMTGFAGTQISSVEDIINDMESGNKMVTVQKGSEMLEVPESDVQSALKDGFQVVK